MRIQSVIGIDIGGTNCRIGLVDKELTLHHPERYLTEVLNHDGRFIEELRKLVDNYIGRYQEEFEVLAVSIGFPSTVDKKQKLLISTPNIAGLDQIPIVSIYEEAFGLPVFIDRDVNMLMYHDLNYFQIPMDSIVLGYYVGTGMGNSILIHNEILRGKNGVAGELGHIPMAGIRKQCTCGNDSCFEAGAAGWFLGELCREKFPDTPIQDIYIRHGDNQEVIDQIERMAMPISAEINIFDPDHIILGGGLLQMKGFPVKLFEDFIIRHTRKPLPARSLNIHYAATKQDNGIIGAGIHGFKQLVLHFSRVY